MTFGEAFPDLLAAAKTGADWAWEKLYRELAGPVTGYLAGRGALDPEDLAGETFLQVARNIHAFVGSEGSFRSWVFVIAHRRLIDARRSANWRPEIASDIDTDPPGGDVESEAIERLVTAELVTAFEVLTDDQREVLALRVIANLTLEETAQVVGKNVGAVKQLQRRALAGIRRSFDVEEVTK
jgi:RNA polymerase sigma-70 factor (ECF subfamily)